jgi:hypothetical protein
MAFGDAPGKGSSDPRASIFCGEVCGPPLEFGLSNQKSLLEAEGLTAAGAANVWGAGRHIAQTQRM